MHDFHRLLQFYLAHLICDVEFLIEHPNKKHQTYGQLLLTDQRRLFGVIHRRDEYASAENFQRALEHARSQLVWDATRRSPLSREAFNLAQRFREHADSYFRFMTQPNFEPTNNLAEHAMRYCAKTARIP